MKTILWIVMCAVAIYAAAIGALFFFQRSLLYPAPQTTRTDPASAGFPQAQEVVLDTKDGERVIVWHVPPKEGKPVVLFFHGNGEVLAWRVPRFRAITADGTGLIALSFRGYGGSSGTPSEEGLLNDAAAAYDFAAAHYAPSRIIPWGYSLGSGVAVAVATTRPVAKLILEAPYTSTVDVAAAAFPWVPVRWLMRDRFHSDKRILKLNVPLLIMHGEKDGVIPIAVGRRLFDLAPGRKRFVALPQGTHINLDEQGAVSIAQAFMAGDGKD
ncbi:alpha/beta hydrolase [Bradyrhizobium sp. SYSU BS000235]|uniref:alpha/beta hydrolase n=1 Tax=Bradyrhizobium sp. SYSU BS000235 TaxID=3411332 RepID=UPI003C74FD1A